MKKFKTLLIIAVLFFCSVLHAPAAFAASFTVNLSGDSNFSDTIALNLVVNNLDGFSDASCAGLCGLSFQLIYDSAKLELTSTQSANEFNLVPGAKIVLYRATGVANGSTIATFTFKNKTLADQESTTIKLTNISGSNGDIDISTADVSKSLTYQAATQPSSGSSTSSGNSSSSSSSSSSGSSSSSSSHTSNSGATSSSSSGQSAADTSAGADSPLHSDDDDLGDSDEQASSSDDDIIDTIVEDNTPSDSNHLDLTTPTDSSSHTTILIVAGVCIAVIIAIAAGAIIFIIKKK